VPITISSSDTSNASLLLLHPDRISPAVTRLVEVSFLVLEVHGFLEFFRKSKDFIHASANLLGSSLVPIRTYTSLEFDFHFEDSELIYLARISCNQ
jgi:hypothetical protein